MYTLPITLSLSPSPSSPPPFPPFPSDFSGGRSRCSCTSFFRGDAGGECNTTLCHTTQHRSKKCLQSRTYAGGKGEQYEYFSVLKKTQPCKWSTLCTEVVHFSEGPSYKLLLLEILLYFFVLEKDPTMQALCPGSMLSV